MSSKVIDIHQGYREFILTPHHPSPIVDEVIPGIYNIVLTDKKLALALVTDQYQVPKKIWGKSIRTAIDLLIDTFDKRKTSMGAILSGKLGSGKTVTAEVVCNRMVQKGCVVVQVNKSISPEILELIRNVTSREVVYYFQEFTTQYSSNRDYDKDNIPQDKLLEFFSSQTLAKSLFILTLNQVHRLNEYFISRPGRFLFHIRYQGVDLPTLEEITRDLKVPKDRAEWLENYVIRLGNDVTIDQVVEIIRATEHCVTLEEFTALIPLLNVSRPQIRLYLKGNHGYMMGQLEAAVSSAHFDEFNEVLSISLDNETITAKLGVPFFIGARNEEFVITRTPSVTRSPDEIVCIPIYGRGGDDHGF